MDAYQETIETWNKIAELYQNQFMDLDLYNQPYAIFCKHLPHSTPSVLEIGCGPGNITGQIVKLLPKVKLLATDVAPQMIALSKKNNPKVQHQILDARDLHTLSNKFHGIISGFTIPYLAPDDCNKFIIDAAQSLNPKGIFYLSFVAGQPKQSGYISGSTGDRTYFHYHSLDDIKKQIAKAGFEIVSLQEVTFQRSNNSSEEHTIIIAEKGPNRP